jgi:immune inhibitor A
VIRAARALAAGLVLAAAPGPAADAGEGVAAAPLRPAEARTVPFELPLPGEGWLGVHLAEGSSPPRVRAVVPGGPAAAAGVRAGDLLASLGGVELPDERGADWLIRLRAPGERVRLGIRREGALLEAAAILGERPGNGVLFRRPVFRLAVIPLALEDLPRPAAPDDAALDRLFFARDGGGATLPSGRRPRGSLRDYWRDQSGGTLDVVGRVLPTVRVPALRRAFADRPMGGGPESLYARAIRTLEAAGGTEVLAPYDGIAFLYPGPVASPPRRGLWPHRDAVRAGGRLLPYYVKNLPEGEIDPLGVHAHEFGHLLGLPDQYGVAHRTGAGDWCLMAIGHRGGPTSGPDRPFGLCAWCRVRLGWLRPAAVDPFLEQDLALAPSAGPRGEAFLVPGGGEGEAFLLEFRRRAGWDAELPGEGLLVWRVGGPPPPGGPGDDGGGPDLVEAHAIAAPDAALLRPDAVPFPAGRRDSLAEETHPGRAGMLRLSRIRRAGPDLLAFRIGEAGPFAAPPAEAVAAEVDAEGYALLEDPVTGERVRVWMGRPEAAPAREPAEVEAEEGTGE